MVNELKAWFILSEKDISLRHLINQTLIIGLQGTSLTSEERSLFANENMGGVILFDRNVESLQQLHDLILNLQTLASKSPDQKPLLIAIDMEGGRVQRLKAPFTQWPAMQVLGKISSPSLTFNFAQALGKELKAIGINTNLAPCLDVLTAKDNQVIGDRAFSHQPEVVERLGSAVIRGLVKANILPCGKHFPGHGSTLTDSHKALPISSISLENLQKHLIPFKKAFRSHIPLLMTAHIKYPCIDPDWPVTLSMKILKGLACDTMGYRHLIMSDDLDMKALRNHWSVEDIAVQAVQAGCHLLLYGNDLKSPILAGDVIEKATLNGHISKEQIINNHQKVINLKMQKLMPFKPTSYQEALQVIGKAEHKILAQSIISKSLSLT